MPRGYSLGKRQATVERTRTAIVHALRRLLKRVAYDDITIRQIAAEADVSEKTVQRHFGSKDAIFVAWGQWGMDSVRARLEASTNGSDPVSVVRQLMRASYGASEENKDELWAFMSREPSSAEVAAFRGTIREFGYSLASAVVEAWPEVWRFDRERTKEIINGLTRYLAWKVLREECGLSQEEAVFAVTETVRRALMKREVGEGQGRTGEA